MNAQLAWLSLKPGEKRSRKGGGGGFGNDQKIKNG
jgi:hypothetical protein